MTTEASANAEQKLIEDVAMEVFYPSFNDLGSDARLLANARQDAKKALEALNIPLSALAAIREGKAAVVPEKHEGGVITFATYLSALDDQNHYIGEKSYLTDDIRLDKPQQEG